MNAHHAVVRTPDGHVQAEADERYQNDPDYVAEGLAIAVTEQALGLMRNRRMTQMQLAENMGVSRGYVSRIFNAPPNLTLRSIAQLAIALGTRPQISILPQIPPTFGGWTSMTPAAYASAPLQSAVEPSQSQWNRGMDDSQQLLYSTASNLNRQSLNPARGIEHALPTVGGAVEAGPVNSWSADPFGLGAVAPPQARKPAIA
jgi:transcriptional regulator with XRE-family HTH domain